MPPIGAAIGLRGARELVEELRDAILDEVHRVAMSMRLQGTIVHSWYVYGPGEVQSGWKPEASAVEVAKILVGSRVGDRKGHVTVKLNRHSGQFEIHDPNRLITAGKQWSSQIASIAN